MFFALHKNTPFQVKLSCQVYLTFRQLKSISQCFKLKHHIWKWETLQLLYMPGNWKPIPSRWLSHGIVRSPLSYRWIIYIYMLLIMYFQDKRSKLYVSVYSVVWPFLFDTVLKLRCLGLLRTQIMEGFLWYVLFAYLLVAPPVFVWHCSVYTSERIE